MLGIWDSPFSPHIYLLKEKRERVEFQTPLRFVRKISMLELSFYYQEFVIRSVRQR